MGIEICRSVQQSRRTFRQRVNGQELDRTGVAVVARRKLSFADGQVDSGDAIWRREAACWVRAQVGFVGHTVSRKRARGRDWRGPLVPWSWCSSSSKGCTAGSRRRLESRHVICKDLRWNIMRCVSGSHFDDVRSSTLITTKCSGFGVADSCSHAQGYCRCQASPGDNPGRND